MQTVKYGFILCLIIGLFIVRYPRSILATTGNTQLLDDFITSTITDNKIDMHTWLELRELYSPGYYTYDKHLFEMLSNLEFKPIVDEKPVTFFTFTSASLMSEELLVIPGQEVSYIEKVQQKKGETLFKHQGEIIKYIPQTNQIEIVIAQPVDNLKRYNGLMAFHDDDPLLQNKVWVTTAVISLPKKYKPQV